MWAIPGQAQAQRSVLSTVPPVSIQRKGVYPSRRLLQRMQVGLILANGMVQGCPALNAGKDFHDAFCAQLQP